MRWKTFCGLIVVLLSLLTPRIIQAQGTTYLSNLGQPTAGSLTVASDSWLATDFITGSNLGGYSLDSIELALTDATGIPNGFGVVLYSDEGIVGTRPGRNLGTLNGPSEPITEGIYTYTSSTLMLSQNTRYYIVVTAGTGVADGAYEWSSANSNSHNSSGGWTKVGGVWTSSNGSTWIPPTANFPQFAINATPIPEPGLLSLLGLGAVSIIWQRRRLALMTANLPKRWRLALNQSRSESAPLSHSASKRWRSRARRAGNR